MLERNWNVKKRIKCSYNTNTKLSKEESREREKKHGASTVPGRAVSSTIHR